MSRDCTQKNPIGFLFEVIPFAVGPAGDSKRLDYFEIVLE
jgi:hypothetical protein